MKFSLRNIFYAFFISAIVALIILSANAIYFNAKLIDNQRYLQEINLIDSSRYQMSSALRGVLTSQVTMLSARKEQSLTSSSLRDQQEKAFLSGLITLERFSKYNPNLKQSINKMRTIFQHFLSADRALESITLSTLTTRQQLKELVQTINDEIASLRSSAEDIGGRLSLNSVRSAEIVKHYLKQKEILTNPDDRIQFNTAVSQLLIGDTADAKDLSVKLEIDLAVLAAQARQLSAESNSDLLVSLRNNQLEQQIQLISRDILQLKSKLKMDAYFTNIIPKIESDYNIITSQLIKSPNNIYELRQSLNKQEEELQRSVSQVKNNMTVLGDEIKSFDKIASTLRASLLQKEEKITTLARIVIFGISAILGILLIIVGSYLLRIITGSLNTLTTGMKKITTNKGDEVNLSYRLERNRFTELDAVINTFNFMIGKLQFSHDHLEDLVTAKTAELTAVHQKLMKASRQAGMAEVATSTLHNIGNVLNSVGVSISLLNDTLNQSAFAKAARAALLLKEHAASLQDYLTQDPKGKLLPEYFIQLLSEFGLLRESMQRESRNLSTQFDYISEIVSMQSALSGAKSTVLEKIMILEAVEIAIKVFIQSPDSKNIQLDKKVDNFYITTDKTRLAQIIVDLTQNAKDSLACMSDDKVKIITILVAKNTTQECAEIIIKDNGVGISAENLTKLFQFGFTTKQKGHGYGLHNSFLSAKELGGTIIAESEGEGKGAAFIVRLPIE